MGKIVSQLLAEALVEQVTSAQTPRFKWISRPPRAHMATFFRRIQTVASLNTSHPSP